MLVTCNIVFKGIKMKMGKHTIIISGIMAVLIVVVMISGCTDDTKQYGTEIYKGNWKVGTDHFGGVKQEVIDAFSGDYVAYKNGTTITLIGTGKQMSVDNDTLHQIKIVFTKDGKNVNTTYYLDDRLGGYSYTNQTTTEQMFNITKNVWELSLTTSEEQLSQELDERTEEVKL
ncbi:MAG: hypothetical protein APG12_01756 [Candidatus Methanofastidiosum methylothiophilum]|uniref:Uncharacterized protein n=1 Tax=Candidatus Methanofastidiosum methylothiophilum TaxID=1705564 RepID=A0A150IV72_9EURY|nr:MAG: hypothetical protein APG12_01756 [Candidatus Methanofastidiosum methylthiophilus]OPX57171.1 MAG: hypothetical protein A4E25_02420 [Methanobacterium sp. PtaB.Bin024]